MRSRLIGFTVALAFVVLGEGRVKCFNCEVPVWGFGDATCALWVDSWSGTPSDGSGEHDYCDHYQDDAEWNAEQDLREQSCSQACQFAGSGGYGNGCDYAGPYDGSGYPTGAHMVDGRYMQDPVEWPVTYTLVWAQLEGYCECTSNEEGPPPVSVREPRTPLVLPPPTPIFEKPSPAPKVTPRPSPTTKAPQKPKRFPGPVVNTSRDPKRIGG
jgi:hypothetical protein